MSAVLESPQVSEGYATDGRMFQPPEVNRDNEQPRYLTFMGSVITADDKRSRPWTAMGGMNVTNPCLRVVKNFLRKGRITPLLRDTHDYLPFDLVRKTTEINPLQAGYFGQTIPVGYVPPNLPPANGQFQPGFGNLAVGGPSPYGNMVGKLAVPGEQINAIIIGTENMAQNNVPRGVRELKSLFGHDYRQQRFADGTVDDSTIRDMHLAIFPTYPALPVLIEDVQALLNAAPESLRHITDEMQESLAEFRAYAESTIQNTHYNMKESANRQGYVWRYTAMDLTLLEQLGMARQDREIRTAATVSANGGMETMFAQFLQSQAEERAARTESDKRVAELLAQRDGRTEKIDSQTIMAGEAGYPGASGYSGFSGDVITNETASGAEVIATAMADTIAEFKCACDYAAKSLAGLKAHQRSCETAKGE